MIHHPDGYGTIPQNISNLYEENHRTIFALMEDIFLKENPTILDAACGNGATTIPLVELIRHIGLSHEIYCFDISQTIIHDLGEKLEDKKIDAILKSTGSSVRISLASLISQPYPNDTFDYAICDYGFNWIEHEHDRQKAFQEFYRVLKPGGRLAVATTSYFNRANIGERRDMRKKVDALVRFAQHNLLQYNIDKPIQLPYEGGRTLMLFNTTYLKKIGRSAGFTPIMTQYFSQYEEHDGFPNGFLFVPESILAVYTKPEILIHVPDQDEPDGFHTDWKSFHHS